MSINTRIFGTPITGSVKTELERRQNGKSRVVYPNESVDTNSENYRLDARTPFVRMWTAVKLIEPEQTADIYKEFFTKAEFMQLSTDPLTQNMGDKLTANTKYKANQFKNENPNTEIVPVWVDLPGHSGKKAIEKYIVRTVNDGVIRDRIDFAREVYVIGDYNYQVSYGQYETNESIQTITSGNITTQDSSETSESETVAKEVFPNELKNNNLLKPKAGIVGMSSETLGIVGEKKQTNVTFIVHNFEDFDNIYNRYFLKPGATIFVDFGWSSVEDLYEPEKLLDFKGLGGIREYLYGESKLGETTGQITKNSGDLEVLQGTVSDYSAKILKNGSIECTVTLTSANTALLEFQIDDNELVNQKDFLQKGTLYYGANRTLEDLEADGDIDNIEEYAKALEMPDANTSFTDEENRDKKAEFFSFLELGYAQGLVPTKNSVILGVYVNDLTASDTYISLGFFEDFVINSSYGFGKSFDDINYGNNMQIRMDSSYSFTTFNKLMYEKQRVFNMLQDELPRFIYPAIWGNFEISTGEGNSLNWNGKKYPFNSYPTGTLDEFGGAYNYDYENKRIPLRELFIHVDMVVKAFEENKGGSVKDVVLTLLEKINDNSDGFVDLQLSAGDTDNEIKIIDNNFLEFTNSLDRVGEDKNQENIEFKNLFTFKIMSPDSIVQDYNLEFVMPKGNLGNMLAITNMSHENGIFPINNMIDDSIAIDSLDTDSLSIVYEPDNGGYAADRLNAKSSNKHKSDVYDRVAEILSTDLYKTNSTRGMTRHYINTDSGNGQSVFEMIEEDWIEQHEVDITEKTKKDKESEKKQKDIDKIQENIDILTQHGFNVSNSFRDYYALRQREEVILKQRPNALPYTLSLKIYGISSLVPGDTFRVDYLPKIHLSCKNFT